MSHDAISVVHLAHLHVAWLPAIHCECMPGRVRHGPDMESSLCHVSVRPIVLPYGSSDIKFGGKVQILTLYRADSAIRFAP